MGERCKRALIVDDETDLRTTICTLLQQEGWETMECPDGEMAALIAGEHQPDLILLDRMMPRQGGVATLRELREDSRTAHIPVIMLTAANLYELGTEHNAESTGAEAGVAPPDAFVEKPFEAAQLLRCVEQVLKGNV